MTEPLVAPGDRTAAVVSAEFRPPQGWLATTFSAFQVPSYRLLWLNSALMLAAVNLIFTVQSVVAFDITGKNGAVGLVAFTQGLAMLIATPFAGVIADRVSKRLLLALAELTLGLMAASISALILTHLIAIAFLATSSFIFGCSVSFFWPAQTALMGDILDTPRRGNGAALFQVCLNLTRSFAPFLAGALLAWDAIGSGGAYLIVAFVFVVAVAACALLPAGSVAKRERHKTRRDIDLGLSHVRENRRLLEAMVSFIVVTLLGFSIMVVLPGLTQDVLHAGDSGFGILFGVNAIGALLASLVAVSRADSKDFPRLLTASGVAFGLTIALTGLMPTFAFALLAMFLVGAAGGAYQTLVMARMVHATSPEYLGRVMSLTNIAWSLTSLLGLLVGVLADFSSQRTVLIAVGICLVLATCCLAAWSRADRPVPAAAAL